MMIKAGLREFLWMIAGAVIFLAVSLLVIHFQPKQSPAEQLAFRAERLDLVSQIRLNLTSASEAEKRAVMAITDQDSKNFADQSRLATLEVDRERKKLLDLLTAGGTRKEKNIIAQFSKDFTELQNIDNVLLALAIKNTNIKAYSLAFGPAADALKEMDNNLSKLVEKSAGSSEAENIALLSFGAQTAALRIQALLAPHIAEESDRKMDVMEALMSGEDKKVRKNLADLKLLPRFQGDSDLEKALADYNQFSEVRAHILALSRENTNVRSLSMSLGQKRNVFLICQDALSSLQQAIQEEPLAGSNYEGPLNPRPVYNVKSAQTAR